MEELVAMENESHVFQEEILNIIFIISVVFRRQQAVNENENITSVADKSIDVDTTNQRL